jgi:hypothetical protein
MASSFGPAPWRRNSSPSSFQSSTPGLTSKRSRWTAPSAPTRVNVPRAVPSIQRAGNRPAPIVTSSAEPRYLTFAAGSADARRLVVFAVNGVDPSAMETIVGPYLNDLLCRT